MEKQEKTERIITDDKRAAAVCNMEPTYGKKCYEDKCMELYALNSDGFVYVVTVQGKGDSPGIYGCFSDSDMAYFCGIKLGRPFKIVKYRVIGEDDTEPADLQSSDISESDLTEGYNGGAVAALCFDEAGTLLDFRSSEVD